MYLGFFRALRIRFKEVVGIFNPISSVVGSTEGNYDLVCLVIVGGKPECSLKEI